MTDPSTAVSTSEPILPLTVVIVGVTGDLTRRLLFPALHRLVAMAQPLAVLLLMEEIITGVMENSHNSLNQAKDITV